MSECLIDNRVILTYTVFEVIQMPDYKNMYLKLIRAQIKAVRLLQKAHRAAERMYVKSKDPVILPDKSKKGSGGD